MSTSDTPANTPSTSTSSPMSADHPAATSVGAPTAAAADPAAASAVDHPAAASAVEQASGADEGGGAEAGGADASGDGAAKKRRRRRRGKKLGPDGLPMVALGPDGLPLPAGAKGAETGAAGGGSNAGAGAEGGAKKAKKKRENRPQPDRERPPFGVGDIVFGKVVDVTEDVLVVDLAGKATGLFDLRELMIPEEEAKSPLPDDDDDDVNVAGAGDAAVVNDGAAEGAAVAASDDAPKRRIVVAPSITEAAAETPALTQTSMAMAAIFGDTAAADAPVPAAAASETEGAAVAAEATGAEVAAAPAAAETPIAAEQAALPRVILEIGAQFVGVIHNDGGRGGYVVLTHHPERYKRAKAGVAQAAKDGTDIEGVVTGVIRGGVEVDIDGLRAFAPASHMDLRMGADLGHHVGNRMTFNVTQYGRRGRDVVLSRRNKLEGEAKALREKVMATVQIGTAVDGIVRRVVNFGAFVDIGGVEGLVPLTEMSHNRSDQPADVFKVGETTRVLVQRVDERGKIWLSHRATLEDPWGAVAAKYAEGSRHTGKVSRLHPAGAFVELEPGIDGMIRLGDLSIKRIESASEVVKEGEEVEVIVAYLDRQGRRISLHLAPTGAAANEAPQKLALHKSVKVQVVAVEAGGLVVRVMGVSGWMARGFVPAMATGTPRGTELKKPFPVGKELDAKVIEMDARKNEVKLSIRAHAEDNERNAYQTYRAQVKREAKFGTFADLLAKRGDKA